MSNETTIKPDFALYKVSGIVLATFCGSIIAGGLLMAKNYKKLGKETEARQALVYSVLTLIGILAVSLLIPDEWRIPNMAFIVAQIGAMQALATAAQGNDIKAHTEGGGKIASNWKALGISLLVMVVLVIALIGLIFIWQIGKMVFPR